MSKLLCTPEGYSIVFNIALTCVLMSKLPCTPESYSIVFNIALTCVLMSKLQCTPESYSFVFNIALTCVLMSKWPCTCGTCHMASLVTSLSRTTITAIVSQALLPLSTSSSRPSSRPSHATPCASPAIADALLTTSPPLPSPFAATLLQWRLSLSLLGKPPRNLGTIIMSKIDF